MKCPINIRGCNRKNRSDRLGQAGVLAQDFCEDVCHQVYPEGSEEKEECLDNCHEN